MQGYNLVGILTVRIFSVVSDIMWNLVAPFPPPPQKKQLFLAVYKQYYHFCPRIIAL
jgi:hypothetical protein